MKCESCRFYGDVVEKDGHTEIWCLKREKFFRSRSECPDFEEVK